MQLELQGKTPHGYVTITTYNVTGIFKALYDYFTHIRDGYTVRLKVM